jgi:hypothetical protein
MTEVFQSFRSKMFSTRGGGIDPNRNIYGGDSGSDRPNSNSKNSKNGSNSNSNNASNSNGNSNRNTNVSTDPVKFAAEVAASGARTIIVGKGSTEQKHGPKEVQEDAMEFMT